MKLNTKDFKLKLYFSYCFLCIIFWSISSNAKSIDPTTPGPYPVAFGEYRFPASVDPDILKYSPTEIWAKVFYPQHSVSSASGTQSPLIIMLHGNHSTCGYGSNPRRDNDCTYTYEGTCPEGYQVVPNHEGYNYLAENLASWGYWVVSINVNRGINCGGGISGDSGLILTRGKMVLKHLELLHQWSTQGGAPASIGLGDNGLIGQLDFTSVGLFGHSRGGEGVRAAYNLYLDKESIWPDKIPGLEIKAIFEVGATDNLSSRILNANGVVWNQLLPMCDGDVSSLDGRFPFERMLADNDEVKRMQKSVYEVWGANHNYFNTEWQTSDSYGCSIGDAIFDPEATESVEQQQIAKASVISFFKSHIGQNFETALNQLFNPLYPSPTIVSQITQVDREFSPDHLNTESMVIENFDQSVGKNTSGFPNKMSNINMKHKMLKDNQASGYVSWTNGGDDTYFKAVFTPENEGINLSSFKTLDFRVSRPNDYKNRHESTDFTIRLEDSSGAVSSPVSVGRYVTLNNRDYQFYPLFQTVRVYLSDFQGIDLSRIHAVQFIFNTTGSGALYLANVQANQQPGLNLKTSILKLQESSKTIKNNHLKQNQIMVVPEHLNTLHVIKNIQTKLFSMPAVEIELISKHPFPVMDSLPVLEIGRQKFTLSRYSDLHELKRMIFTLSRQQFDTLDLNGEVILSDGKKWQFGVLHQWLK